MMSRISKLYDLDAGSLLTYCDGSLDDRTRILGWPLLISGGIGWVWVLHCYSCYSWDLAPTREHQQLNKRIKKSKKSMDLIFPLH